MSQCQSSKISVKYQPSQNISTDRSLWKLNFLSIQSTEWVLARGTQIIWKPSLENFQS